MFTVCPKCALTLAVTANDLRVGQGYVRCGRCANVFNALLKLSDVPYDGAVSPPSIPEVDPATNSQITRALTGEHGASASPSTASRAPSPPPSTPAAPGAAASNASPAGTAPRAPLPRSTAPPRSPASPAGTLSAGAARAPAAAPAPTPARPRPVPPLARGPGAAALLRPDVRQRPVSPAPSMPQPAASQPAADSDTDAIDQFELVLQTLGVDLDEDESTPKRESAREQLTDPPFIEIVLEGDEVTQTVADPPEQPLDDLDRFARRLSLAAEAGPRAAGQSRRQPDPAVSTPSAPAAPSAPVTPGAPAAPSASRPPARRRERPPSNVDGAGIDRTLGETRQELAGAAAPSSTDLEVPGLSPAQARPLWWWVVGCALLLVLLGAQAINHWRASIAGSPTFGAPLMRLYAALGFPIQPHWDLAAYEIRQQGAESEGGTRPIIRVRFSLANHAPRAQPAPLLRLTLLDRYGKRLAQRDLAPGDYWPRGQTPSAFLRSDERIDTSVQVQDPSADSASFELDVCLPDAQHDIQCAGDGAPTLAATP